jgi:hypothetical protein
MCLLVLLWLFLALGGLSVASSPSRYPPVLGWAFVAIAVVSATLSIEKWVRALPGLLGIGALNSLLVAVDGHLVGDPSKTVPRLTAVVMLVLFSASAAIAVGLTERKLTVLDKAALSAVVVLFFVTITSLRLSVVGLCLILCCLASAAFRARHSPNARP